MFYFILILYLDSLQEYVNGFYRSIHMGVVEVKLHLFLTLALDGGEWSTSRPCRFIPEETAPVSIL